MLDNLPAMPLLQRKRHIRWLPLQRSFTIRGHLNSCKNARVEQGVRGYVYAAVRLKRRNLLSAITIVDEGPNCKTNDFAFLHHRFHLQRRRMELKYFTV